MRTMCDAVFMEFKRRKQFHSMPRVEGRSNPEWVLIDTGSLLIHIMEATIRAKYNLESLWALRPSAEDLAMSGDTDWEADLFPEFAEAEMMDNEYHVPDDFEMGVPVTAAAYKQKKKERKASRKSQ